MIRSLSRPAPSAIDRATLVLFSAGRTLVGAPVESVERVLRGGTVQPLAEAHALVVGVVEHAGRAVPVLDLSTRLAEDGTHVASTGDADRRTLVIARGSSWFALEVDAVHEIMAVDATRIQRCVTAPDTPVVPHVLGELQLEDRIVRVLNVARLLTAAEWQAVAEVHATSGRPAGGAQTVSNRAVAVAAQ